MLRRLWSRYGLRRLPHGLRRLWGLWRIRPCRHSHYQLLCRPLLSPQRRLVLLVMLAAEPVDVLTQPLRFGSRSIDVACLLSQLLGALQKLLLLLGELTPKRVALSAQIGNLTLQSGNLVFRRVTCRLPPANIRWRRRLRLARYNLLMVLRDQVLKFAVILLQVSNQILEGMQRGLPLLLLLGRWGRRVLRFKPQLLLELCN